MAVIPDVVAPELDWELLYDIHAPKLRRIIERKVGSALADDVLQETFLRAFKCRHTIDPDRPIAPWLITIALRTATDVHRRRLRSLESADLEADDCQELALDSLEEELLTRARRIGIRHAFASLNIRQRHLLELVAVDGLTYESVADQEDMTADAVKSALARARTNFRTSYNAFARDSGLLGVGVGGWLLRKLRLRRSAVFVGHHAAGFGAATLSIAVVAAVAVPAVRPTASEAKEHRMQPAAASAGTATTQVEAPASPATEAETPVTQREAEQPTTPKGAAVQVAAGVGVANSGSSVTGTTNASAGTASIKVWDHTVAEVDCTAGVATTAACAVMPEAPLP